MHFPVTWDEKKTNKIHILITRDSPPVVTYAIVPGVTVTLIASSPALDSVITGYSPGPSEATTAYPS